MEENQSLEQNHISLNSLSSHFPKGDAYYGLAGDIVKTIAPHTEADPIAVLIQLLSAFGNVIGRVPHFKVEKDIHPMRIWPVLVGQTSKARKGTSWGIVKNLFTEVDPGWVKEHITSGLSSGEGLIHAVRDNSIQDKRLFVVESEFASVLKQADRQGNILSPIIRQAWDTGDLNTIIKNSPDKSTGAHITIIGHITQDELTRYLTTTEIANGFGNRFLWVFVKRANVLPHGGSLKGDELNPFVDKLRRAVEFSRKVNEIPLSEEAKIIWEQVYEKLSEGKQGMVGSLIARAEAYARRCAGVYTLLDCSEVTRPEHLKAGLAIVQYVEDSLRHIFGNNLGDPFADDILHALRTAGENGLSRTDISNKCSRHKTSLDITRVLDVLSKNGFAEKRFIQTSGRPIERWFAVAKKAN